MRHFFLCLKFGLGLTTNLHGEYSFFLAALRLCLIFFARKDAKGAKKSFFGFFATWREKFFSTLGHKWHEEGLLFFCSFAALPDFFLHAKTQRARRRAFYFFAPLRLGVKIVFGARKGAEDAKKSFCFFCPYAVWREMFLARHGTEKGFHSHLCTEYHK
jgi:hypothetical protein